MKKFLLFLLALVIVTASAGGESITVKPDGGDYSSFTQAVYETYDSGRDIVVYPGEYDIRQEYVDYFKMEEINDQTDLGHMFQFGVRLFNRKVTFLPGAKLKCIWYFPTDYSARFCPIYMTTNAVIDGLDLYAEGMEYAIHDDVWRFDEPYVNEYRHCRIVGRNLFGANCIGGGVTKNSRIIIDNCWFDNGVDESVTVRYHNTDMEDAEGDIWISNSYFNGYLAMCYYGESAHLNVYINGCEAAKVETIQETEDSVIANIDLYKWNNDEKTE